jgi:hypothetical protein
MDKLHTPADGRTNNSLTLADGFEKNPVNEKRALK